jgi:serine protease Do
MYNDENNQYNPRPRFDPKTGERIHYDDENTTETTQAESSEYRYSAGNIPFEQENNNTSYYQQSSTFQQDTTYQQAGAGQGSMNQQNGRQKKKKDRNKEGFGERLAKLAGSAAVFGVIAGAVMYGVYYTGSTILPVKSSSDYNNIATVTSNVTATTAQSSASSSTGMDVQSVANAALPAMVALNGTTTVSSGSSSSFYGLFGGSQSYEAQTSGTGIIVGKNDKELLVVTNAHVVEDVNDLKCVFVDGESVSATVKGSKSDKDIAVVAINLSDIKDSTINSIAIAELADSDDVAIGQEVVAIGNALGEGQSVTNGIISATNRSITVNNVTFSGLLMTNAAINSGNSGGALLNAEGKVIAINFAKTSSDGVEGMAYSIPVSNVMDIIDSLMSRETRTKVSSSETAYLGISGVDITSAMSSSYGYPQGVLIRSVENNSAAAQAGLGAYDIIVSFDDQSVNSMSSLKSIMEYYAAGEKVTVQYYHQEGSEYVLKSVEVTLGKKS